MGRYPFLLLAIALAISQARGQDLSSVPACAQSCISNAIASSGCSPSDISCICSDNVTAAATPCVISNCNASDALATQQATSQICSANAPITTASGTAAAEPSAVASSAAPTSQSAQASGTATGGGNQGETSVPTTLPSAPTTSTGVTSPDSSVTEAASSSTFSPSYPSTLSSLIPGSPQSSTLTTSTTSSQPGSSSSESSSTSPTSSSIPPSSTAITDKNGDGGKGGLSTGAKAGIGIGAALGFLVFVALVFWWGRRSTASRHRNSLEKHRTDNAFGKTELGAEEDKHKVELEGSAGIMLSDEEKGELHRRRRAAELEGREVVSPVEGWRDERAELQGRRMIGNSRYEIG